MIEVELQIDYYNTKRFYIKGTDILHRVDGPACESVDGEKRWYQHGKLHRLDGPAIEYADGSKYWYLDDKRIYCQTQQEFESSAEFRKFKLKAFW